MKTEPKRVYLSKGVVCLGDSFSVLPTISNKRFDHVITDVPYNLHFEEQIFLHEHFRRIAKEWIIIFSPPENEWLRPADQIGFWVKPISTKNTSKSYSRFVEMIFFYGDSSYCTWNVGRHWSQYTNVFHDLVQSREHPYKKPWSLMERLILNHTKPGHSILDPFAGSGTTVDVCKLHGRIGYGIDNDPEFGQEIYVHEIEGQR